MFPTTLKLSDLAESKLPPKTVSIYNFPNFIAVQKRAGLPVNQHLVFFHQLLSTPFKLIGLAMLAASFTLLHFSRQTKIRLRCRFSAGKRFLAWNELWLASWQAGWLSFPVLSSRCQSAQCLFPDLSCKSLSGLQSMSVPCLHVTCFGAFTISEQS